MKTPAEAAGPLKQAEIQEITLASLRSALGAEAAMDDGRVAALYSHELKARDATRKSNKHFVLMLDHALKMGTGKSLSTFVPKRRTQPIGRGSKRYFTEMAVGTRKRSCAMLEDGSTFYEFPLGLRLGGRYLPSLHMCSDQGL